MKYYCPNCRKEMELDTEPPARCPEILAPKDPLLWGTIFSDHVSHTEKCNTLLEVREDDFNPT